MSNLVGYTLVGSLSAASAISAYILIYFVGPLQFVLNKINKIPTGQHNSPRAMERILDDEVNSASEASCYKRTCVTMFTHDSENCAAGTFSLDQVSRKVTY